MHEFNKLGITLIYGIWVTWSIFCLGQRKVAFKSVFLLEVMLILVYTIYSFKMWESLFSELDLD